MKLFGHYSLLLIVLGWGYQTHGAEARVFHRHRVLARGLHSRVALSHLFPSLLLPFLTGILLLLAQGEALVWEGGLGQLPDQVFLVTAPALAARVVLQLALARLVASFGEKERSLPVGNRLGRLLNGLLGPAWVHLCNLFTDENGQGHLNANSKVGLALGGLLGPA